MNAVDDALDALRRGEVVVVPTETVYGLAASPTVPGAVARLFELKGRAEGKAIPILGADLRQLASVAAFDDRASRLARSHWPGGVTLVLGRADGFDADLGGEGSSVAVRVPASDVTLSLLHRSGPLAVTSANASGAEPATTVDEARAIFGSSVAVYLDGGPSDRIASTVLSLVGTPKVLREGIVPSSRLLDELAAS